MATPDATQERWDTIVIGSGFGGLSCASALAHSGQGVLVLESHTVAGGLTHVFEREGWSWDVGVHYIGQMAPGNGNRRLMDWVTRGGVDWAPMPATYDRIHFPDDVTVDFTAPEAALRANLAAAFPGTRTQIDAFFDALKHAEAGVMAAFRLRALPGPLAAVYRVWAHKDLQRWVARTTDQVLDETVTDLRLRAALAAQWGDYGSVPAQGSFAFHALIMRHYLNGAWYPVGGAASLARAVIPVIESAGGAVRTSAPVASIELEHGRAAGLRMADGTILRAANVVSSVGARATVARLLAHCNAPAFGAWKAEVLALQPSLCHVCLYLGFEGDIAAAGASGTNHWIYNTWDMNASLWTDPFEQPRPPAVFVSFPSLKDTAHPIGPPPRHTAEVVAMTGWDAFGQWEGTAWMQRPDEYGTFKRMIHDQLMARFAEHFPALLPMVRYSELSTPLSTAHFTRAEQGAIYGLEATPRRMLAPCLRPRSPSPACSWAVRTPPRRASPAP